MAFSIVGVVKRHTDKYVIYFHIYLDTKYYFVFQMSNLSSRHANLVKRNLVVKRMINSQMNMFVCGFVPSSWIPCSLFSSSFFKVCQYNNRILLGTKSLARHGISLTFATLKINKWRFIHMYRFVRDYRQFETQISTYCSFISLLLT